MIQVASSQLMLTGSTTGDMVPLVMLSISDPIIASAENSDRLILFSSGRGQIAPRSFCVLHICYLT